MCITRKLYPTKWRSAELSAAITVTSQHICFKFQKVKPCRAAAVEGACGCCRLHTHAHPNAMLYVWIQPVVCLMRGARLGRTSTPFLLVLRTYCSVFLLIVCTGQILALAVISMC